MRVYLPSTLNAKKASKELSKVSGCALFACRDVVAKSSGYRDWHDLEQSVGYEVSSGIELESDVISSISQTLGINAGTVLHVLSTQRFFGNSVANPEYAISLRTKIYEKTELPPKKRGEIGYICKMNIPDYKEQHVILRAINGNSVTLVNHNSTSFLAIRNEVIFPRTALPLFIPQRLWMPYGKWTEADGSIVLFSRDYFPLWRIRPNSSPERLNPKEWIKHQKQEWLWQEGDAPWYKENTYKRCIQVLQENNIRSTPVLCDFYQLFFKKENLQKVSSISDLINMM